MFVAAEPVAVHQGGRSMASEKVSGTPTSEEGTPGGDWREVTQALDALGDSITRAMRTAVENDEYRRRIRELRDGLAYLAIRIGEPAEGPSDAGRYREPMRPPAAMMPEQSAWAVPPAQPQGLDAFRVANEKFRQGADSWDSPAASAPTAPVPVQGAPSWAAPAAAAGAAAAGVALGAAAASAVPAPVPVAGGGSVWSAKPAPSVWSTPATPAPASVQAAAAAYVSPFVTPAAAPAAPVAPAAAATPPAPEDLLGAIRATNERFQAERAAATAAAGAAAAPEPVQDSEVGEADEGEPAPFAETGEADEEPEAEDDGFEDTFEVPVEEEHAQLFEETGEDGPGDTPPPSPPSDFTP
jgi:hypothetical protein